MKCLKCSEQIIKRINFRNLFQIKYQVLCNKCEKELVFGYYYETIPINSGLIHHHYLKLKDELAEPGIDQFMLEPFFQKALTFKRPVLYFDKLDDKTYQILDNLNWGDLFIITIS